MKNVNTLLFLFSIMYISCTNTNHNSNNFTGAKGEVRLMTIDPGHFHAALVQKQMYNQVSPHVFVFAPEDPELMGYLQKIDNYNNRETEPTKWSSEVYSGIDFLKKMISDHPGNLMITSGNNRKKTEYIKAAVDAKINVLADKPMAINKEDFALLKESFKAAEKNNVLLYDIMTERFEITTILQKELSQIPEIFGQLVEGTPENPAISKESVHHFFKYVSGNKLKRPAWFFDVEQEGEGIVDVTTHLVDLVQWECFPEQIINYKEDIKMLYATRWPTELKPKQFYDVTGFSEYPKYLSKDIINDSILQVFSNGEIIYQIKGVIAKVSVIWNFQAPQGTGDTHYSIMRGSKSNLVIKQGAEQNYKPALYIEPISPENINEYEARLTESFQGLEKKYPGISLKKEGKVWEIIIPDIYKIGHEAHFAAVTKNYLNYLVDGKLPEWEVPNMISKYYITTEALEMAKREK